MFGFFDWLLKGLKKVLAWLVGLPGLIVSLVASLVAAIGKIWDFFTDKIDVVSDFCSSLNDNISSLGSLINSNEYFSFFCYVFSLDVAWSYLVDVLTVVVSAVGLIVVGGLCLLVAWLIQVCFFRAAAKAINLFVPFVKI